MKREEKANNGITELVFILDRSGSMSGLEEDTIGGFNSMLEKQKGNDGECYVTTVIFDHEIETIHDRIKLSEVPKMTEKEYSVRGSTALIDAIGKTVEHISDIHKYARAEDVPSNVMFVITTDGLENSSHMYTSDKVKKMIEKKKKEGWEFLFIGANIDSVETARHFGISEERAVNYHADKKGTRKLFSAVGEAVCCMRGSSGLAKEWRSELDEDYENRK
ncbi:MAG: VWA domain-containing protein [Clostridia bacterium]|nr:VWA domain-containing protein [Clostridia bacterium]